MSKYVHDLWSFIYGTQFAVTTQPSAIFWEDSRVPTALRVGTRRYPSQARLARVCRIYAWLSSQGQDYALFTLCTDQQCG